jgi:hypothetical protein
LEHLQKRRGMNRAGFLDMSDDKTKTAPQDANRVNVSEDYEVQYWTKKFGSTPERLKAAVKKVGVMAKDVEAELKRR